MPKQHLTKNMYAAKEIAQQELDLAKMLEMPAMKSAPIEYLCFTAYLAILVLYGWVFYSVVTGQLAPPLSIALYMLMPWLPVFLCTALHKSRVQGNEVFYGDSGAITWQFVPHTLIAASLPVYLIFFLLASSFVLVAMIETLANQINASPFPPYSVVTFSSILVALHLAYGFMRASASRFFIGLGLAFLMGWHLVNKTSPLDASGPWLVVNWAIAVALALMAIEDRWNGSHYNDWLTLPSSDHLSPFERTYNWFEARR